MPNELLEIGDSTKIHNNNREQGKSTFLQEYAESRIRPTGQRHGTHDGNDNLEHIPQEQRDELVDEVTDSLRKILVPVCVCLASVIVVMASISFYSRNDGIYLPYTPFHEDGPISNANKFGYAIANSFIIIGVVVAMTALLILLYYFRFYKIIYGWLIIVSLMVLFIFSSNLLLQIVQAVNISFDYISYAFLMYNFGIMGMISIHWKSPLKLQQFYLISTSLLISLVFIKYLPEWTSWVFLIFLATYDIIAVLCPGGPLKILLKIVQERNEPLMPALIYSSMVWFITNVTTSRGSTNGANSDILDTEKEILIEPDNSRTSCFLDEDENFINASNTGVDIGSENISNHSHENLETEHVNNDENDYEVSGIKLGLGDFIFYSVLIGKAAASNDWNTVYACTIGILTGLCSTLILLAVSRHALPALPISIAIGVLFYFTTFYAVTPMMDDLTKYMIFI